MAVGVLAVCTCFDMVGEELQENLPWSGLPVVHPSRRGLDAFGLRRINTVRQIAISMFPDLEGLAFDTWMGVRPSFPDSLPVLGEIANRPGLIGVFGHSHYGLMMAPRSGRMIATLMSGRPLNIDVSPYASNRF